VLAQERAHPLHLGDPAALGRRTPSLDALLPVLYLRGVSMGDFQEALGRLLGKEAPNLSPSVIARLRDTWQPTTRAGNGATWRRGGMSTSGRTASICRRDGAAG
jgi:hypothetical protein